MGERDLSSDQFPAPVPEQVSQVSAHSDVSEAKRAEVFEALRRILGDKLQEEVTIYNPANKEIYAFIVPGEKGSEILRKLEEATEQDRQPTKKGLQGFLWNLMKVDLCRERELRELVESVEAEDECSFNDVIDLDE